MVSKDINSSESLNVLKYKIKNWRNVKPDLIKLVLHTKYLLTAEHQFLFWAERNIENDLVVINCASGNVIWYAEG